MNTSPIRTSNPSVSRTLAIAALILTVASLCLVLMVNTQRTEAQSIVRKTQMDLLSVQASAREFYQTQAENQQYREQERLNVPQLAATSRRPSRVPAHADLHFRHVTCKICRAR
jgi:hypothetical protein